MTDIKLADDQAEVGKITGVFGVRGWVKVWSYTDPIENLLDYSPWQIRVGGTWKQVKVLDGRVQGRGLVAQLEGISDRNEAELLQQAPIVINRSQMVNADEDEFFLSDLEGLTVVNESGVVLGLVDHFFETKAHDVMVVKHGAEERLLPWVPEAVVKDVDMEARKITVVWELDW